MKTNTRLLALLLALLMLLSATLLTSCDNDGPADPSDPVNTSEPDDTSAPGGSDVKAADLALIADGKVNFRVIRDEDMANGSAPVSAAASIRTHIINTFELESSNHPEITDDWKKPTEEYDHDRLEILVGTTDYSESKEALAGLSYGEYIIKVVGNKLVVAAYADDAITEAGKKLEELITSLASDGNLTIPGDTCITGNISPMLSALPSYEGGSFSSVTDSSNGGDMLIVKKTTADECADYVTKLEQSGFDLYTTHTITENTFATLTNDSYTVNVGYYDYEKSARIIIEPLADAVGLKEDNIYTEVTTSQITMLGLEYDQSIGLSLLIRLTDGRFIVVDGGFTSRYKEDAKLLVDALKEQSKDYLKSGEQITIAAWIITHAHGDHSGMIRKSYSYFKDMKIEKFLVNFLAQSELNRAMSSSKYGSNYSSNNATDWQGVVNAAKALKADIQYVRVGQVFYMANASMEILYTIDSYSPRLCNAFNTTSLVIKFTFDDGTTFMLTGDATGDAFQILADMYGTYLQSDILQVSHHGCKTWNNDSGTVAAYKRIAPATLLWPRGFTNYESYQAKGYNLVLYPKSEGGQNDNFKEYYIAGYEGESVTLPIPYQVGTAIVKRVS